MAQKKQPAAKRARNKDGTYKGDDKSTPNVNEAYEQPKKATKATATPRNPASRERAKQAASAPKKPGAKKPAAKKAPAKKPAAKKPHTYAPPVKSPVSEMLTKEVKPAKVQEVPPMPKLSRFTPPPAKKKGPIGKLLVWMFGE